MNVTVIGAGICGLCAALSLEKKGIRCSVLAEQIGMKTCGGGFTEKCVERYPWIKKNMDEFSGRSIKNTYWWSGQNKIIMDTDIIVAHRQQFDKFLWEYLRDSVKFLKCRVTAVDVKDKIKILTNKGIFKSDIVFDASGSLGPIIGNNKSRFFALQHVYPLSESMIDREFGNSMHLFNFYTISGRFGYSWIFPDRNHVKVGSGVLLGEPFDYKKIEAEIAYIIKQHAKVLTGKKYRKEGGFLSSPAPRIKVVQGKYFIGGDAAGLVNALGEGNYYGILSAEMFAQDMDPKNYSKKISKIQDFLGKQFNNLRVALSNPIAKLLIFKLIPMLNQEKLFHDILKTPPVTTKEGVILDKL